MEALSPHDIALEDDGINQRKKKLGMHKGDGILEELPKDVLEEAEAEKKTKILNTRIIDADGDELEIVGDKEAVKVMGNPLVILNGCDPFNEKQRWGFIYNNTRIVSAALPNKCLDRGNDPELTHPILYYCDKSPLNYNQAWSFTNFNTNYEEEQEVEMDQRNYYAGRRGRFNVGRIFSHNNLAKMQQDQKRLDQQKIKRAEPGPRAALADSSKLGPQVQEQQEVAKMKKVTGSMLKKIDDQEEEADSLYSQTEGQIFREARDGWCIGGSVTAWETILKNRRQLKTTVTAAGGRGGGGGGGVKEENVLLLASLMTCSPEHRENPALQFDLLW